MSGKTTNNWSCEKCTFINTIHCYKCKMCSTNRTPPRWPCPRCTFIHENNHSRGKCCICGFKLSWKCSRCTFINTKNGPCEMCGNEGCVKYPFLNEEEKHVIVQPSPPPLNEEEKKVGL